jgi:hypothetical protein
MSPHVLVPGAWEQEQRNAAHKQQQQQQPEQQQPQLADLPSALGVDLAARLSLSNCPAAVDTVGLRAAVVDITEEQHVPLATPPSDPLGVSELVPTTPSAVKAVGSDPLNAAAAAGDPESDATSSSTPAGAVAESGSQTEPEFTDPLRRRTLHGDEGLLGDDVGLSEDAMQQQEAQDAAAMAALADFPCATQGLQLYDRCVEQATTATAAGMKCLLAASLALSQVQNVFGHDM